MSYKEKAGAVGEYRGGAIEPKPAVRRYPCFAAGCPMPGTIFPGAGVGGTGDSPGTCAWHYGVKASDVPRVTRVLQEWSFIAYEAHEARRVHCNTETATDLKAIAERFEIAVERLRPLVAGRGLVNQFEPGSGEDYREWGKRLQEFLGGQVTQVLTLRHREAA